jgi:hypothetical protein
MQVGIERTTNGIAARLVPGATAFEEVIPDNRLIRIGIIQSGLTTYPTSDWCSSTRTTASRSNHVGWDTNTLRSMSFWNEVVETYRRGQSVVVYQHFRREKRASLLAD